MTPIPTIRRRPKAVRAFFAPAPYLLALCLLLAAATGSRAGVFNPETFTLKNGMQVVVIENHRVPVVTHMVWYKVGSADEGPGESGIAHFLEHLMFKGTKKRAPGEFSRILARNGGRENAFTSADYTAYHQTVAVDRLEMVMEMEADRMTNLVLDQQAVTTERLVVLEERRQRTDNNPSARLQEQVNAALFLNYPYRRPVIGWEHEIKALDLVRVIAFYKKWYAPNNAILVVAGDITAEQLKPLAEKYYGVIPAGPKIERRRPTEPPPSAARRVKLEDMRVRQPSWSRYFLAPSLKTGLTQHAYPLEVLGDILGGGSGRLYQSLVVDNKIAVSAGSHYGADDLGPGQFVVYASPQPGVGMDKLEESLDAEIRKLLKDGVTDSEVARAKKRLQSQAVFARDSMRAGAHVLGSALASGLSIDDVEKWPERIGAVTVDQINAAARAVLTDERSVTALLLPKRTS
jgi:zinc protease